MKTIYEGDFERWCAECVTVSDKITGEPVPFILNNPQRRLLGELERQRLSGRPIRIILLKARQWGGSTLVQTYMAWMQLVRHEHRNAVICAHVKDAAANIRGMYSRLLREYPESMKGDEPKKWVLTPYEKSSNINYIAARDCCLAVATSVAPDSVRGINFSLAHMSEVAFWGDGDKEAARRIVRTVCGSVALAPETMIVMESTANGRDNFFYDEWCRAERGESDKTPVFVAWHEIEIYRRPVAPTERESLIESLDNYERRLLDEEGLPIEAVAWYHDKRKEYSTHEQMMAEYPGSPEEAFASSGRPLFTSDELPGVAERRCEADRCLAVFMPGAGDASHILSLSTMDRRGIITHRQTELLDGRAHTAALRAVRLSREQGCMLLCLDTPDDEGLSHTDVCRRVLEREGTRFYYVGGSDVFLQLNVQTVSDMADRWRELSQRGLTADAEQDAAVRFASLRHPVASLLRDEGFGRSALCRMAAAYFLADMGGVSQPQFEDFV